MITSEQTPLRYLDPNHVAIEGAPCDEMTIRAETGDVLGKLDGFVVDAEEGRLRYLVVRTAGFLSRTRLLPCENARVDMTNHAIEVPDETLLAKRDFYPSFDLQPA